MHISLSIKKDIYRDYLKGMFEPGLNGCLVLSKDLDFGAALISRIRYTKKPVMDVVDHTTIRFELPAGRSLASASNHYLSLTKDDESKLNDQLEVMFNLDLDTYFLEGCKMGMMKKDIVEAFIITRKIVKLIGDNETLKKREYRDSLLIKKKYTEMLLRKTYYRNTLVEKALKRYNPLIAS